jgi:hypothetical protein
MAKQKAAPVKTAKKAIITTKTATAKPAKRKATIVVVSKGKK